MVSISSKPPTFKESTPWMWYLLMGLYYLYFGQSAFFPSITIIGQILIFLILFMGLVCLLRSMTSSIRIPLCLKWIVAILVILTISFILSPKTVSSVLLPSTSTLNQFKDMVAFFLPIFTGYQIGLHRRLTAKQWAVVAAILVAIAVNAFFEAKNDALERLGLKESTNNSAYVFLYLIAFIPLILRKYRVVAFALLAVCFAFVMMGAKRGAIICMAFMLLYLMWWYFRHRRISFGTIVSLLVLVAAIIVGTAYFFTESDYLQERMEQTLEGNSSRRDILYYFLWDAWVNADFITQIFGRGSAQTVEVAGNYAHNDWLELLTDVGLLGALIYLAIFVSLFRFRKKLPKNSPEQASFTIVLMFWFLKTIFSMGMGIMGGIGMMLLGTLMGNEVSSSRRVDATHNDNIIQQNNELLLGNNQDFERRG